MRTIRKLFKIDENTWHDGVDTYRFENMSRVKENINAHERKRNPHPQAQFQKKTERFDTPDDLVVDASGKGLVLKDNGTPPKYWRVTVDAEGKLVTNDLGSTKPERANEPNH